MQPSIKPSAEVRPSRSSGFTLIEIMIAVAIIGILAAIAIPSYQESIRKARRGEARAALAQLMLQQERYFSVKNTYLAFTRTSIMGAAVGSDLARFKWHSNDVPENSHYEISAEKCSASLTIDRCVKLTASESSTNVVMFTDPRCGDYILRSDGVKSNHLASGTTPPLENCW